jgi:hypothetical protein
MEQAITGKRVLVDRRQPKAQAGTIADRFLHGDANVVQPLGSRLTKRRNLICERDVRNCRD